MTAANVAVVVEISANVVAATNAIVVSIAVIV